MKKYHAVILLLLLPLMGVAQTPIKRLNVDTLKVTAVLEGILKTRLDNLSDSTLDAMAGNPAILDSINAHRSDITAHTVKLLAHSDSLRKSLDSLATHRNVLNGLLTTTTRQADSITALRVSVNLALSQITPSAQLSDSLKHAYDSLSVLRTLINGNLTSLAAHLDSIAALRNQLNPLLSQMLTVHDSLKHAYDSLTTVRSNLTYLFSTVSSIRDSLRSVALINATQSDSLRALAIATAGSNDSTIWATQADLHGLCNLSSTTIDWSLCPQFKDTLATSSVTYTFTNVTPGKTIRLTLVTDDSRLNSALWPDEVHWPTGTNNPTNTLYSSSVYALEFTAHASDYIEGRLLEYYAVVGDTVGPDVTPPPPATDLTATGTTDKSASLTFTSMADDLDSAYMAYDTRYIADYDATASGGTTNERTAAVQRGTATFSNGSTFYIATPLPYDSNLVDIQVNVELGSSYVNFGPQSYTVEPANNDSILVRFGTAINAAVTLTGTWSVVQDSGMTTTWVRSTLTSGTSTGTTYIGSNKDTTKSWIETGGVFAGIRYPSSSAGLFGGAYWRFKSGRRDTVEWVAPGNIGTTAYGIVQVHTYDSCTIAGKGLVTLTNGGSLTGTVTTTAGDTTKQLGVLSSATSGTSSRAGRRVATAEPTSTSQWTVTRGNTTSILTAYLFVPEFTDATGVTRYRSQLDAGSSSTSFSAAGDLTYSTPHVMVRSATNTTDTAANVAARVTLAATSSVSRQKASTQTNVLTSAVNWGGIRTVGSSSGPDTVSWPNALAKVKYGTMADSGQSVSMTIDNLNDSTTYYFSVKQIDTAGNVSLRSNTVSARTQDASVYPSDLARVWAVDDLTKVMDQDLSHDMATSSANRTWQNGVITLDAFKGETVAFQLILQGSRISTIPYVSVTLDSLYLSDHSAHIKNDSTNPMAFNGRFLDVFVAQSFTTTSRMKCDDPTGDNWGIEYNQLDNYPPRYYPDRTVDTASFKGQIPKILVPVEVDSFSRSWDVNQTGGNPFSVPANQNRTIWVDVFVPRTATAGVYEGYVNIKENALLTRQIPVSLNVYNVTLGTAGTLPNSFYFSGKIINHNGGIANNDATWWTQYLKLVQLMHRHGISLQNWAGVQNLSSVYNKVSPRADKYTLDKNSAFGQISGTLFTTGRGYDGPFYNTGDQLIVVGEYTGTVGFTPLSSSRVDTTAYAWGQALTDSSATAGKYLFFSPTDEPTEKDPADVTLVQTFGGYLNDNTSGVKQYARQGSMGAAPTSVWYDYIKYWMWAYTTDGWSGTTAPPAGNSYNWYTARQRRNAGQVTGVYNFHVAHNTHGWAIDAHPSNLTAFLWGARKDSVQMYALWTTAYFEEKWYIYSVPRSLNYWSDPQTNQQFSGASSQVWPGNDTAYTSLYDRDFDGYLVTTQVKAWRRGQEDRILLQTADSLGVTYIDLYDSLNIGRWLDKWKTEPDGNPLWTYRTYTSGTRTHYVPNSPAAHNQNGYAWTRIRRLLRQRINAIVNP